MAFLTKTKNVSQILVKIKKIHCHFVICRDRIFNNPLVLRHRTLNCRNGNLCLLTQHVADPDPVVLVESGSGCFKFKTSKSNSSSIHVDQSLKVR